MIKKNPTFRVGFFYDDFYKIFIFEFQLILTRKLRFYMVP
jgi:hypothetical protein